MAAKVEMRADRVAHWLVRAAISDFRDAMSLSCDVIGSGVTDEEDLNLMI